MRLPGKFLKRSMYLPPDIAKDGEARAAALGLSFSAYVAILIRNDLLKPDESLPIHPANGDVVKKRPRKPRS